MITLYHCAAARSFRPLWTLEELGLPYDLKMLPFPPRVFAKEYLGLNPLGTIPLLLDGETRMTESAGISHYLVARYGPTPLAVGVDEPDYGAFLNWLHFGEATLTFPQTLVLRYTELEPEERRNPQVATDYAKWFFGRLRAVEAAAAKSEMLCAGRFTAADISVGYALLLAERLGLSRNFGPAVAAYWQRLQARDGFRRAVEAEISRQRSAEGRAALLKLVTGFRCVVDCEKRARCRQLASSSLLHAFRRVCRWRYRTYEWSVIATPPPRRICFQMPRAPKVPVRCRAGFCD